jgi:hypothetical protein
LDVATACQSLISGDLAAIATIELVLCVEDLEQCLLRLHAAYLYADNPAHVLPHVTVARLVDRTPVVLDAGISTDMSPFTSPNTQTKR